jgi:5'-nucleotidase
VDLFFPVHSATNFASFQFLTKTNAIKNKHLPIHLDFSLPEEVRKASDHQWFTKIMKCFVDAKFPKSLIPDMLEASQCRLRSGVVQFLRLAHQHRIPVLIFSGGIKDVIDALLHREKCYFDNISIISNRLKYDDSGTMVGAVEPYITASSKLEVAREDDYFKRIIRDNVLLLGDMLSDLKMASCVKYKDLLTVGFCNHDKDEEQYRDSFDMILMGNPSFSKINELLSQIVGADLEKSEL